MSKHLSVFSMHVPQCGECLHCPFVNQCNSGEMCIVDEHTWQMEQRRREKDRMKYAKRVGKNVGAN